MGVACAACAQSEEQPHRSHARHNSGSFNSGGGGGGSGKRDANWGGRCAAESPWTAERLGLPNLPPTSVMYAQVVPPNQAKHQL